MREREGERGNAEPGFSKRLRIIFFRSLKSELSDFFFEFHLAGKRVSRKCAWKMRCLFLKRFVKEKEKRGTLCSSALKAVDGKNNKIYFET